MRLSSITCVARPLAGCLALALWATGITEARTVASIIADPAQVTGELMDACRYYIERTGRRLTFEWALIEEENDTEQQAHLLGDLLQGMLCHVNLIPLNTTKGYNGRPSSPERVDRFQAILAGYGVSSTVRVRRGIDIQAGCGQLRDRIVSDQQSGNDKGG